MKKLILSLFLIMFGLTACGDDYASASAAPPATWAGYTCQDLSFRFIAGWQTASWEGIQQKATESLSLLNSDNRLTMLGHYASPVQDQNTTDYLTIGYYSMTEEVTGQTLESIMNDLNSLDTALTAGTTEVTFLQKTRIRMYEKNTALTFAIKVVQGPVTYVAQVALIPQGQRLYQVIYSDFSTKEDSKVLEQMLTSLTLPQ